MEVYANIVREVSIDPKEVIENLIEEKIGWRGWVFEREGKFFRGYEVAAGQHSAKREEEISKEDYEYIKALQLIRGRLE